VRRQHIALRIYAFTAAIAVTVMVALYTLPRFVGSPHYLEPQAALVQNIVDRLSVRIKDDPAKFDEAIGRLTMRIRGQLALYDVEGRAMRTIGDPAAPISEAERRVLDTDKWALSWRRIVVRSDDGTMLGVYVPAGGFPWNFVLPLAAGVLVVVGAASLWFSRRLVRPLRTLAAAARQFGGGDLAARAQLTRRDELGEVGHAFDEMADRTAALLSAQRQLMADVSHELRTPLARIRVALELAVEDPAAAKDVLADVGGDLDEIDQLIEDILTTARLETTAPIARQTATVREIAERASERFRARHPDREIARSINAGDEEIDCDPVLLRRALDNLLDNAAKYSDAAIDFEVAPGGDGVAFTIVDRGIGMTEDELRRAGTPFWRADGSRTRTSGGVGLGLALARRIARAHGGDVTLASTPGHGTTARLEVPVHKAQT